MRTAALAATLLIALSSPRARAAGADRLLEEARRHMAALRYGEALEALERALAAGESGPGRVREIYRLGGELAAGLGRPEEASRHFRRLLSLDPDFTLPEGSSPKLTEPLSEAKEFVRERGALAVHHELRGRTVTLVVDRDPLSMVRGARARYRAGGEAAVVEGRGRARVPVEIPGGGAAEVVIAALDRHGNELLVLGSDVVPIRIAKERRERAEPPFYARWTTWAGAALVASFAGGGFAFGVLDAQNDLDDLNRRAAERPFEHDFAEAEAIERRGHRFAVLANVSFAVAAVTGATAAALLGYDWLKDEPGPASVSAAATGGGFSVGLSLRY